MDTETYLQQFLVLDDIFTTSFDVATRYSGQRPKLVTNFIYFRAAGDTSQQPFCAIVRHVLGMFPAAESETRDPLLMPWLELVKKEACFYLKLKNKQLRIPSWNATEDPPVLRLESAVASYTIYPPGHWNEAFPEILVRDGGSFEYNQEVRDEFFENNAHLSLLQCYTAGDSTHNPRLEAVGSVEELKTMAVDDYVKRARAMLAELII